MPCGSCAKKGHAASCSYGHERRNDGTKPSEAHLRLQKLEEMVTRFMQNTDSDKAAVTEPCNPSVEQSSCSTVVTGTSTLSTDVGGGSDYEGAAKSYHGATHWATVLENVSLVEVGRF